jgi:hypothetical protein
MQNILGGIAMFQNSCFLNEVTDFRKLGTGRKRTKVFVVSESHEILFSVSVIAFGSFVAQESGRHHFWNHPSVSVVAKKEIGEQLKELGFMQVQRLSGMLFPLSETVAA